MQLRDLTLLSPESLRVLTALVDGTAVECQADAELAEQLHKLGVWQHLTSAVFARPPLSTAALKLMRAMMSQSQKVVDRIVELGARPACTLAAHPLALTPTLTPTPTPSPDVPAWILQCREQSDVHTCACP